MNKTISLGFQPELQGLRAIAVVLVIFAHLGVPSLAGGFIGVDVFFVLSGFLITSRLLQEYAATGRVSLGAFYMRRLRRLFPVLMVVLALTSIIVIWQFSKADSRIILASLPFAALSLSNMFFVFGEKNYFNELADKDVFLHTWSLGVEEQFYLVWPLIFLALIASSQITKITIHLLFLVITSFFVSLVWTFWHPISAFYVMPSRIWQFGLGGLIYLYTINQSSTKSHLDNLNCHFLLMLGLMLILGSAFFLDEQTNYPGYWALLPSIGAAFVILAVGFVRSDNKLTLLSHPILVWLGDRSYSLYLWHWPIIVMLGLISVEQLSGYKEDMLAIFLTLVFSMISYRWIELPFWKEGLKSIPAKTFILAAIAAIFFLLALSFHLQRQVPQSIDPQTNLEEAIRSDLPVIYSIPCDAWYHHSIVQPCLFGENDAPNTVVLLADSIGAQWFSALEQIYVSDGWRLIVLTKSSCAMVDEDYFYGRIGQIYEVCRHWREDVLRQMENFNPKVIIVGSAATYDFSPGQWVNGSKRLIKKLSESADQVVIFSGTPSLEFDGPSCIGRQLKNYDAIGVNDCKNEQSTEKVNQVADYLSEASKNFSNVRVFNPVNMVCPGNQCSAISLTGIPVFRDSQHLTDSFVRSKVEDLRKVLPYGEINK